MLLINFPSAECSLIRSTTAHWIHTRASDLPIEFGRSLDEERLPRPRLAVRLVSSRSVMILRAPPTFIRGFVYHQILFIRCHHDRSLMYIRPSKLKNLLSHLSDVLKSCRGSRCIKDQDISGGLPQATECVGGCVLLLALNVPFLEGVLRKFGNSREIRNLNFNDAVIVGHHTGSVAVCGSGGGHAVTKSIAYKLLQFENNTFRIYF